MDNSSFVNPSVAGGARVSEDISKDIASIKENTDKLDAMQKSLDQIVEALKKISDDISINKTEVTPNVEGDDEITYEIPNVEDLVEDKTEEIIPIDQIVNGDILDNTASDSEISVETPDIPAVETPVEPVPSVEEPVSVEAPVIPAVETPVEPVPSVEETTKTSNIEIIDVPVTEAMSGGKQRSFPVSEEFNKEIGNPAEKMIKTLNLTNN